MYIATSLCVFYCISRNYSKIVVDEYVLKCNNKCVNKIKVTTNQQECSMRYNEISGVVDTGNKSKELTSSENNVTNVVTSLQKTLNNVEYCKPKLSIPVSFKRSCSDGVLNILSKHGFTFKDKAEVNSFILRFLASKDLPIYLENKNYLGEINHVMLNLFTCSENFDDFFGWMKEEKRVMAAKNLVG